MMTDEKTFLDNYRIEDYERPSIAADIVTFAIMRVAEEENFRKNRGKDLKVLLIKRGTHPFINKWALPGGFVKPGESVLETARRELLEETNISNAAFSVMDICSDADRDPRGWIISNSYMALVNGDECELRADTDAWEAAWFTVKLSVIHSDSILEAKGADDSGSFVKKTENKYLLELYRDSRSEQNNVCTTEPLSLEDELTETIVFDGNHMSLDIVLNTESELAFDHAKIILKSILKLREKIEKDVITAFDFLPERFTLSELQNVIEQIMDKKLLTANFRRSINDYVIETDEYFEGEGHRPAKLYRRNPAKF